MKGVARRIVRKVGNEEEEEEEEEGWIRRMGMEDGERSTIRERTQLGHV